MALRRPRGGRRTTIEGFDVLALEIPHKGGRTFGYRVSDGRASIAYLSDHGPVALGPGPDGLGPYHEAALALADGVDLLVHDAQHTAEELPAAAAFGHSAAEYAVALAERAGAGRVLLFHHDPTAPTTRSTRWPSGFGESSRSPSTRDPRCHDPALTRHRDESSALEVDRSREQGRRRCICRARPMIDSSHSS